MSYEEDNTGATALPENEPFPRFQIEGGRDVRDLVTGEYAIIKADTPEQAQDYCDRLNEGYYGRKI